MKTVEKTATENARSTVNNFIDGRFFFQSEKSHVVPIGNGVLQLDLAINLSHRG